VFDVCVSEAQHSRLSEVIAEVIKKRQGDNTIFVSSFRESVQGKAEYLINTLSICPIQHTFLLGHPPDETQQLMSGSDLCVKSTSVSMGHNSKKKIEM